MDLARKGIRRSGQVRRRDVGESIAADMNTGDDGERMIAELDEGKS